MAKMVDRNCKCCGKEFTAREADVKRGWAKFCSKSCKAKKQEAKTGQHSYIQKYKRYQEEFGGIPQFDRHGEYVGFQCEGFSNEGNTNG